MWFYRKATLLAIAVVPLLVEESVSFSPSFRFTPGRLKHTTIVIQAEADRRYTSKSTQRQTNEDSMYTRIGIFNRQLQAIVKTDPYAAERAEKDLLERVKNKDAYDVYSFNIILLAWSRQQGEAAVVRSDALLQILKTVARPDTFSYSAVLNALSRSSGGRKAALRAQELVDDMETSKVVITNDICHNTLMNTWAGQPDGGEKCGLILEKLEKRGLASTISYNACIKAWMRTKDPQRAGPEAQKILDRLKEISQNRSRLGPDKVTYTSTINAWVNHYDSFLAAQKADHLLRDMEAISLTHPGKGPDIIAYTTVLAAVAKAGNQNIATDILKRMAKYGSEPANVPFYNALINVFAKSKTDGATSEALLRHMETQGLVPDKITYSAVIATYANHGDSKRAILLLNELYDKWENCPTEKFLPNSQIFLSVLYAIKNSKAPDALEQASLLVDRLKVLYERNQRDPNLEPNRILYSQFFQILCNSDDGELAAKRASQVLEEMTHMHSLGYPNVEPDASIYAYVITTLTKAGTVDAADRALEILDQMESKFAASGGSLAFQPTSLLYSAVMQACAKTSSTEYAQKAELLLRRNLALFASGKKYAKPSTQCYNAVIDAHARSGAPDASKKAETIMLELESSSFLSPNTRTYNAVLLALKNTGAIPQRAEEILKRMNTRYKNGDKTCRPDRVSINTVISILAKHGQASRALQFMSFLESSFEEHGDASLKPDIITYNSVLDAISRSGWVDAGPKANEVFQRMIHPTKGGVMCTPPNSVTFASLRHAWSKTDGGKEEAERMHQAMEQAKRNDRS